MRQINELTPVVTPGNLSGAALIPVFQDGATRATSVSAIETYVDSNIGTLGTRMSGVENDTSVNAPAICSSADVWFQNGLLAFSNLSKITHWSNSGTIGTPITQATASLQPILKRAGVYAQPFAEFTSKYALQATIARSFPCTVFTVVKTGFPTTAAMCPWSTNAVGAFVSHQSNTFADLDGAGGTGAGSSWFMTGNGAGYVTLPINVRTAGHWMVMKCILNGPNSVLSINGDPLATAIGDAGTSAAATVRILGSYVVGSNYCDTSVMEHIEFPGVLSADNQAAVMDYLNNRYVKTSQLICDGSSITQGSILSSYPNSDWPSQILAKLKGNWTVHNLGVGGQHLANMVADAPSQIDTKINLKARYKILVAEGPTNSIFKATSAGGAGSSPYVGATATTIYNDYVSYCLARREAGYKVIVTTIMNRTDGTTPSGFNAMRQAFNTLVRANAASFSDGLVDIAADVRLQTPTDTTYFVDQVHLTVAGLAIFAQLVANVVNRLTDITGGGGMATAIDISGNAATSTSVIPSVQLLGDASIIVPVGTGTMRLATALTTSRVFTIPSAANYQEGATLTFVDSTGSLSSSVYATLTPASGTINGLASIVLETPYASRILTSNGTNWNTDIRGVKFGGTGATTAAGAATNLVDGNAINPSSIGATTRGTGAFTTGSFTGTLTGVAGTFSGAVSGTTGTFSGAVSGTTATFTAGTFSSTLGVTGALTGTSASFSTTLGVTGVITASSGINSANDINFTVLGKRLGFNSQSFLTNDGLTGAIGLSNGTNAQALRVYTTFTTRGSGTTNLEALDISGIAGTNFRIQPLKGSAGGTARGLELCSAGTDTNGVITPGTAVITIGGSGGITMRPLATMTPANNGDLTIEITSNTSLTFRLKGSDGTVRSAALTLA